jgi:hypothetical protein
LLNPGKSSQLNPMLLLPSETDLFTGPKPNSVQHRFGTSYAVACRVSVSSLRAVADYGSPGPRLYDPYIVQDDGTLYPLPVRVLSAGAGDQARGWG